MDKSIFSEHIKKYIKNVADSLPYVRGLVSRIEKQGRYPAGHYYSPIPEKSDVEHYLKRQEQEACNLSDIDLQDREQLNVLSRYSAFYKELPFRDKKGSLRYYYDQGWFCYFDAISLYCFLRDVKPKRIIEVGSGYSSAVMLDTIELYYDENPQVTFIEPYTERLHLVLRGEDWNMVNLLQKPIQEISPDFFDCLESGDLLFIDSSHVVKYGSDLHYLFFNIINRLKKGVYLHFHDIIYPFEYLEEWLRQGRYWNESYLLRGFLAYNNVWKIHFFNSYMAQVHGDKIKKNMPACMKNAGGSIYLKKV